MPHKTDMHIFSPSEPRKEGSYIGKRNEKCRTKLIPEPRKEGSYRSEKRKEVPDSYTKYEQASQKWMLYIFSFFTHPYTGQMAGWRI